jgi:hypothetical protein
MPKGVHPIAPMSVRREAHVREDRDVSELSEVEVEAIRKWLVRNQFDHVSGVGGDSAPFGDSQDVWERDGTLLRLARDRGQWWYDLSRSGTAVWLDVDAVAAASGCKSVVPVERVADVVGWVDDRVFAALATAVRHSR